MSKGRDDAGVGAILVCVLTASTPFASFRVPNWYLTCSERFLSGVRVPLAPLISAGQAVFPRHIDLAVFG